jgi:hypothetical protein
MSTLDIARPAPQPGHTSTSRWRDRPVFFLVFCAAVGWQVCAVANALSRMTLAPSPLIFWAGLLLVMVPIGYRLTSPQPSSSERLVLVCVLGLALYGIKLARDPFMFTYPDELVHAYNAIDIVRGHALFGRNPVLPVTPSYPGLEGATSALTTMTGLSTFGAGILLLGAARLVLVIAIFLLFWTVSGSHRVAGLGTAIYAGNANFVYFGAQYSYESLALPLLICVLACVAYWWRSPARAWWLPIGLGTAAVVVTHHLTSFALTAALLLLWVLHLLLRRRTVARSPWPFAALAVVLVGCWLWVVGGILSSYLSPVFAGAISGIFDTVSGESAPRQLFKAQSGAPETPLAEQLLTFGSVLILAAGMAFGLRQVWRRHRTRPFALLFSVAGMAYFGTLGLRLAPGAWEVGNRASEFLFIGLGFVVGCSGVERWTVRGGKRVGRALVATALGIIVMAGVISGWPASIRLSQPIVVAADGRRIESEPLGLGRWVSAHLPSRRFAATEGDARMLLVHGRGFAIAGSWPDVKDVVGLPRLAPWQIHILEDNDLRYVVADRRASGRDRAPFFAVRPPFGPGEPLLPPGVVDKFDRTGAARLFDSGNIVVFDMENRP